MKTAERIQTVSQSATWGPKTFPPSTAKHGPFYPPSAIPAQSSFSYEEQVVAQWVKPSPPPVVSWEETKRKGVIRMTEYEARRETVHNFVAGRERCAVNFYVPMNYTSATNVCLGQENVVLHHIWREQGDFPYWSSVMAPQILSGLADTDTRSAVASTQTRAIAAFKGGYDVLTEMAEARQGYQFFAATSASVLDVFTKFFKNHGSTLRRINAYGRKMSARDLLKHADKAVKEAGNAWLAYRYAIMPLYYSYKDVSELIERSGNLYQTFREFESIDIPAPSLAGRQGLLEFVHGTIEISSTIKAGYSSDFLRDYVSNGVQTNPFATAWELVPLSFVMDWFVNVGDFIVATTSANWAPAYAGCTAVKTHVSLERVLKNTEVTTFNKSFTFNNPCYKGVKVLTYPFSTDTLETVQSTVIEHYVRTPFKVDAAQLALYPSLNWKRYIDAAALSHSPLKKLLRRIIK